MPYRGHWPAIGKPTNCTADCLGLVSYFRPSHWLKEACMSTMTWPTNLNRNRTKSKPSRRCGMQCQHQRISLYTSIFPSRYFLNEKTGHVKKEGEIFYRTAFANTLRDIAQYGVEAFYNGTIGDQLVEDIGKREGIITKQDLQQYRQNKLRHKIPSEALKNFVCHQELNGWIRFSRN